MSAPDAHACKMLLLLLLWLLSPSGSKAACTTSDPASLIRDMQAGYSLVRDYQAMVEVKVMEEGGSSDTRRFLYTFMKPDHIRIDLHEPHRGAVLVYPDEHGKVVVRPPGWLDFLKLRLAPDSRLITDSTGQPVDQTDLGLLIDRISQSVGHERLGPVQVSETGGSIRIAVLAEHHFLEGVPVHYLFEIDRGLCLPVRVVESTPDGVPRRIITISDLGVNRGISEEIFEIDGDGNP